jgi:2,4-dienoyl-CoA reductase-like NADH-dependent reductase (Old Yellow Enzyme family)
LVWPENLPLTVRISGSDWVDEGWTVKDSIKLALKLKNASVDLIDCSSGGNVAKANIPFGPGYQVPISEAVRDGANIQTAAVGLITNANQADQIIRNGRADIVLLGREMLRNPYWPIQSAKELNEIPPVPNQYLRGY